MLHCRVGFDQSDLRAQPDLSQSEPEMQPRPTRVSVTAFEKSLRDQSERVLGRPGERGSSECESSICAPRLGGSPEVSSPKFTKTCGMLNGRQHKHTGPSAFTGLQHQHLTGSPVLQGPPRLQRGSHKSSKGTPPPDPYRTPSRVCADLHVIHSPHRMQCLLLSVSPSYGPVCPHARLLKGEDAEGFSGSRDSQAVPGEKLQETDSLQRWR